MPFPLEDSSFRRNRVGLLFLLLGGGFLFLWGINDLCNSLIADDRGPVIPLAEEPSASSVHVGQVDVVLHVLATLAAVVAVGNLLTLPLRRLGQPPVIGEVIAGILLGPSVLGAISPGIMHLLIPDAATDPAGHVRTALETIAQLGIILYMFLIGLELNTHRLKDQARATISISFSSMLVPFVAGICLALWLFPSFAQTSVSFTSFALFLGVALSITAFPVLARILAERKLEKTDLGILALGSAATSDVAAWCLLAFVVGVLQSDISNALFVALWTILFIALMFMIVRPVMIRFCAWTDHRESTALPTAGLFVALLSSAMITDLIGIHAVFGSFLLGAMIPHDSRVACELGDKLYDVTTVLLLPAFFAMTGMNTKIGLIHGWDHWGICLGIIAVASAGKFIGTLPAARWSGYSWRDSSVLGILMNTRGLMELIVLDIGVALGVISPTLFAMLVLMAIATTVCTSPILSMILRSKASGDANGGD